MGNLLDNAIDFTPQDGTIVLSAHQHEDRVTLQVTDSGSGIPDFALPRIFERFYSLPARMDTRAAVWGWRLSVKLHDCMKAR